MTHIKTTAAKTFIATLCLSASLIVPAAAADMTFLPDIPADQIARDTARSYDSRTGVSIVTAPTFDPFEQDNTLAGTAALRTGPSETTINGARVVGGAYLDLKMIYTSPSDDPYDLRGYEQVYYVSGEPVARIHQDVRTLDCASNTTEVVYQDDYYNTYDNYGYLAGLYLLLPRYRGHRGYWSGSSRHRPSAGWGDWRRQGGFSSYNSYGGGGYSSGHGQDRSRGYGTSGRSTRGTGTRGTGTRGSGTGTGRNTVTARTERHNGRNAVIGGSAESREYRGQRGVVTGGPLQTSRDNRAERNSERAATERAESRNSRRQDRTGRRNNRNNTQATRAATRPSTRTERPAIRETVTNRRANPAGAPPASVARQAPPRSVTRPAPVQRAEPKTERKSSPKPVSKTRSSRRVDREVDRSFRKNTSAKRGNQMNFFPMLGGYTRARTNVVTNYRCVREETVTLHIPQERLDAARFDGMTLVVVDNADRDVPVYLPPNYIEGFRQATGRSSAYQSGSAYTVPSTTVVTPQPSYSQPSYSPSGSQGSYPQN